MKKVIKILTSASHIMELIIAVVVLAAVIIQFVSMRGIFTQLIRGSGSMVVFERFLESVLILVIGIEFFRMLVKPDISTVMEVILFVLARHMIVIETTSLDNLLTVVGIALVVSLDVAITYLKRRRDKERKEEIAPDTTTEE